MNQGDKTDGVFIHQQAIVESKKIGTGTRIWAFAHILSGARIGSDCNICDHTFIENDVVIGNRTTIKCGVFLWDGLRIEDDVFIGPNATFTNDLKPRSKVYPEKYTNTLLKTGSTVGAGAIILAGVTLGRWSMVGAGSVVTKNVPDYALVYGNPAQIKGYLCQCTQALKFIADEACCSCGKTYELNKEQVSQIK